MYIYYKQGYILKFILSLGPAILHIDSALVTFRNILRELNKALTLHALSFSLLLVIEKPGVQAT